MYAQTTDKVQYFYLMQQNAQKFSTKPSSERKGDHEVVEGACVMVLFSLNFIVSQSPSVIFDASSLSEGASCLCKNTNPNFKIWFVIKLKRTPKCTLVLLFQGKPCGNFGIPITSCRCIVNKVKFFSVR